MNFIELFVIHLFIEIFLTLISSLNEICLCISMIISLLIIIKYKYRSEIYYSSLLNIFLHYLIFTLSYAEILPWETVIVIILFLIIIYYNIKYHFLTKKYLFHSFPFDKIKEENDSKLNILSLKCQLVNVCFYLYTLDLCLTTICTPEMYFNWFLIIKNCRYTYSYLHSSYTLSGGMVISLPWAIVSICNLIQNRVR